MTSSFSVTTDDETYYDVIVRDGAANTITLADHMTISNDLTVLTSTFDTSTYDLTVGGNVDLNATVDASEASTNVFIGGNWDSTGGTFTYGSGTVRFTVQVILS